MTIEFFVPGKPTATARPRIRAYVDKEGRARGQAYNTQATRFAHQAVREAAQQALSTSDTSSWPDGPVALVVQARFAYPKSTPKKRLVDKAPMPQRPDVENVVKTVMDGCTGVLWHDDSQVAELIASKVRVINPMDEGIYVLVEGLE